MKRLAYSLAKQREPPISLYPVLIELGVDIIARGIDGRELISLLAENFRISDDQTPGIPYQRFVVPTT